LYDTRAEFAIVLNWYARVTIAAEATAEKEREGDYVMDIAALLY
jgi:hypothetical protein